VEGCQQQQAGRNEEQSTTTDQSDTHLHEIGTLTGQNKVVV
jgi:hypothetical protein